LSEFIFTESLLYYLSFEKIMNKTELIRTDEYIIHSYEVDCERRLRLAVLNRYMQESAWQHAEMLGAGYASLLSKNFAWVLTRTVISIEELPIWGNSLILSTWPSGLDHLFAYRDFLFLNTDNQEIGRATTSWCVIDLETRRPQPVAEIFPFQLPQDKGLLFAERPPKVESLTGVDYVWRTRVGYQDIDTNEHVNNGRYIDWIYETFPLEFLKTHRPQRLEINYLAEAFYNHEIIVTTQKTSEIIYLHSIVKMPDHTELCRAKTIWR